MTRALARIVDWTFTILVAVVGASVGLGLVADTRIRVWKAAP